MFDFGKIAKSFLGEEGKAALKGAGKGVGKIAKGAAKHHIKSEAKEWWENHQSQPQLDQNSKRPLQAWQKIPPKGTSSQATPETWFQAGVDQNGWVYYQSNYGKRVARNMHTGQSSIW